MCSFRQKVGNNCCPFGTNRQNFLGIKFVMHNTCNGANTEYASLIAFTVLHVHAVLRSCPNSMECLGCMC